MTAFWGLADSGGSAGAAGSGANQPKLAALPAVMGVAESTRFRPPGITAMWGYPSEHRMRVSHQWPCKPKSHGIGYDGSSIDVVVRQLLHWLWAKYIEAHPGKKCPRPAIHPGGG